MASFSLSPDPLTFGCVSVGYAYSMRVVLTSFTSYLERFKIEIKNNEDTSNKIKCHYSLKPLAPGMQLVIKLTFNARECNHNNFPLSITLASTKTAQVFNVSALVVPPENFKKTARNLRFNGKSIYPPGVDCIGAISQTQSSFIGQGAPSIYSENLVTEEDLEELQQITFARNMYWNPHTKKFVRDEKLSEVLTAENWSVEESRKNTEEHWDKRIMELEEKGMVTERALRQIIKERSSILSESSCHTKTIFNES